MYIKKKIIKERIKKKKNLYRTIISIVIIIILQCARDTLTRNQFIKIDYKSEDNTSRHNNNNKNKKTTSKNKI